MDPDSILTGLDEGQRRAATAVRGPVCILAGAGTGKTTTVTRRIAYQVATGTFPPEAILAVTFTDKAAGEMRQRLAALGVTGVEARTFHAAALSFLRRLGAEPPERLLASKAPVLRQVGNRLPKPYRFRPAADLAAEVEWAKNRRLPPPRYVDELGDHEPPIPADLMAGVYHAYERAKARDGAVDFEDLLERCVRLFETDPDAAERFRNRFRAFTVDEYQDVNLLQQSLLERWLGGRDELCAVGDDYQSIYSFTGASPDWLLRMARRFPAAVVVTLEANHRSTPEVLDLANRLAPRLGGARKMLRPTLASGPVPLLRVLADRREEARWLAERVAALHQDEGVPLEEMAVLYRVNAASDEFEEAFAAAGLPFQVRDGAFLARPAARRLLPRLGDPGDRDVAARVRREALRLGLSSTPQEETGDQEATRQADLSRLVRLAEEFEDGARTVGEFRADLEARFGAEGGGRGVQLLTYHRAKGLEFEAVFLPRLEEGEMPFRRARTDEALAEERRLLYVGITRARRHLTLTWTRSGRRSRHLAELDPRESAGRVPERAVLERAVPGRAVPGRAVPADGAETLPALGPLKAWRLGRARSDGVPAYVVFHDTTLEEIARRLPRSREDLGAIVGVGPAKLDRYGKEVLSVVAAATGT